MIKVLKEKSITLAEVKKILEDKNKNEPLTTIEQTTLDYARKFAKIPYEKAIKLMEDLINLGVSEDIAIQIVNILPRTIEELRTIVMKREEREYEPEFLNKILELISQYKEEENQ